jgi:EAL domain-containing protein (putative c-di-GMP-specific phosphodiesterase class I)
MEQRAPVSATPPNAAAGRAARLMARTTTQASAPLAALLIAGGLTLSWLLAVVLGGAGQVAPHWFYVPVLYAAARFGNGGAFGAGIAAGLLAGPALPLTTEPHLAQRPADWLVRLAFFVVIGQAMASVIGYSRRQLREDLCRTLAEQELRLALARGQIEVFYQPVVNLHTGAMVGAEALARWRHPQRGVLGPDAFIPLAEESGIILDLGEHVLRAACAAAARWQAEHPDIQFELAVNVSPVQIDDPGFPETVRACLEHTGLRASQLTLELTETVLVADAQAGAARLDALRRLGVKVALDDFGTGHSTIAQLHCLPIDIIKIDRSFTATLGTGGHPEAVTTAAIRFAHDVGLWMICEGVETADQARQLLTLGCRNGQGYYFSPPVSRIEFDALLRSTSYASLTNALLPAAPPSPTSVPHQRRTEGPGRTAPASSFPACSN